MKRKLLIAITLISIFPLCANAQLRFGVKGGLVLSKLSLKESPFTSENRTGYAAGVQLDLGLPLGFGLSGSLLYSHRNDVFSHEDRTFRRDYIEIPVHLRYGVHLLALSHVMVPYAFTGPNFSFLCAESDDIKWDNRSMFTSWDVGFGVELLKHVQIQACYGIGITEAFKQVGLEQEGVEIKGKDRCWTISAAYLF